MINRQQIKWFIGAILLVVMMAGQKMAQEPRAVVRILIDNTGSMRQQLGLEKEIAKQIITASKTTTYFSLFGFQFARLEKKERAVILAGSQCSTDRENLKKEIDILPTQPGQTMLYDTIRDAADFLDAKRPTKCNSFAEKTPVVISDGEDRESTTTAEALIGELKRNGMKVFAIGLIEELTNDSWPFDKSAKIYDASTGKEVDKPTFKNVKNSKKKAKNFLEKITKETGGKVIFPKKQQTAEQLVKLLFEPSVVKPK